MFIPSKRTLLVTTAVFSIAGSGAALAYWSTTGSGTGTATTATSSGTVNLSASAVTGLVPGTFKPVTLTIANPGSDSVRVGQVTVSVNTFTSQGDNTKPACTEGDFEVQQAVPYNGDIAGTTSVTQTAQIRLKNLPTNQDNCKGLGPLALTLTSN